MTTLKSTTPRFARKGALAIYTATVVAAVAFAPAAHAVDTWDFTDATTTAGATRTTDGTSGPGLTVFGIGSYHAVWNDNGLTPGCARCVGVTALDVVAGPGTVNAVLDHTFDVGFDAGGDAGLGVVDGTGGTDPAEIDGLGGEDELVHFDFSNRNDGKGWNAVSMELGRVDRVGGAGDPGNPLDAITIYGQATGAADGSFFSASTFIIGAGIISQDLAGVWSSSAGGTAGQDGAHNKPGTYTLTFSSDIQSLEAFDLQHLWVRAGIYDAQGILDPNSVPSEFKVRQLQGRLSVPEPATLSLLGLGLVGLGMVRRRRRA